MSELKDRLQNALGTGYRVERELGGGGMSRVFIAEEVELGRRVVVKVLPPEMGAGLNAERFRREIQMAASLQHPHVVPLHSAGRRDDLVWYTMPLIEGESLRARLAREGELPVLDAVRILRDVADSLAYAHAHGVVHRDIKPDNVLLSGHHAVVTDFGVAKAVSSATGEASLTSIGVALGTPAYMAPEQATADPHVDHRADIYALGAMGYELLTGAPPFTGPPQAVLAKQVTQAPEPVAARRGSVPPALAALVMRCLEKKPADRWQSAAELHQQLEVMATPSGGLEPTSARAAVPASSGGALTAGKLMTPMRLGVAAVLVLAAALAIWRPWGGKGAGLVLDPHVVAVLPFRVAGADPGLTYLRQGMVDLLHAKLTGQGGPRAADAQSVIAAVRDLAGDGDVSGDRLVRVARHVGSGFLIQGNLVGQPEHFVLNAALLEMPGARTVAQASVEGSKDSLFSMVDHLAQRLLAQGSGAPDTQLDALTTTSFDALRAYLDGQAAYRRGEFEQATRLLTRAVGLDSSFALALSALLEASGWSPMTGGDPDRIRRLAWQYRSRLHPTDQQFLSIRLGSRWPDPTPWTEKIQDRERLTQTLPESPLAWYYLGDGLFHYGGIADIPDALERSRRAFEEAARRDSLFASPLEHLARLADIANDTAAFRRWSARRLALDSVSRLGHQLRGERALFNGDEADLHSALTYLADSAGPTEAVYWIGSAARSPPIIRLADTLIAIAQRRATNLGDQLQAGFTTVFVRLAEGRPAAARRAAESVVRLPGSPLIHPIGVQILLATVFEGDSTGIGAARQAAPSNVPALSDLFVMWDLWRGDRSRLERDISEAHRNAGRDTTVSRAIQGRRLAVMDAWASTVQHAPNASQVLAQADSALRGWGDGEEEVPIGSTVLARLWEESGHPDRALVALDRAARPVGQWPLHGIATRLRMEGRLAASTGDRARAITAYRTYLLWRANPESALIPQRDSVRAELARLDPGQRPPQ